VASQNIRQKDVDWICLAEDRDHWHAVVNVVMNVGVPCIHAICSGVRLLASDADCFVSS
jgi:hypothetical protein